MSKRNRSNGAGKKARPAAAAAAPPTQTAAIPPAAPAAKPVQPVSAAPAPSAVKPIAPAAAASPAAAPVAAKPALVATTPKRAAPTREQVLARAHSIWERRGKPVPGTPLEDWVQAERELGA